MPELPASVRLSLWTTYAWAHGVPVEDVLARALPDVDHVAGDLDRLTIWRELGEQALLVALPSPGDLSGMPGASLGAQAAAAQVGECVFVPGVGGMLVPAITSYGSETGGSLDLGTRVDWTAYDADPVARHRVEALEPSQLERHLREAIASAIATLDAIGGQPFAGQAARELADTALGGRWGLPDGLPGRSARVIALAGTVAQVVEVALAAGDGALTAAASAARHTALLRLRRAADDALAAATSSACAVIAGWRPA
ncbi:MAG TPA: hypothetical protein VGN48_15125 [Pedococcus sp.]|nr:hypothetical protein [Pedococcus sp.]